MTAVSWLNSFHFLISAWNLVKSLGDELWTIFMNSNISIFRLHLFTFFILISCAIMDTLQLYIGTPISCLADSSLNDIIYTYCWNIPTHIIPDPVLESEGTDINDISPKSISDTDSKPKYYHQKHHWVVFQLLLQATLFYASHYVSNILEGDLLKMITKLPFSVKNRRNNAKRDAQMKRKADNFILLLEKHSWYAFGYIACEVFNFFNVILQICYIRSIVVGNSFDHGLGVLLDNPKQRVDSLAQTFPVFTKCVYLKPGPGGTILEYNAVCVLAINKTNQIIFIVLAIWFWILAILSGMALFTRFIVGICPSVRKNLLAVRSRSHHIDIILEKCQYGDWFVLYQLRKHCDAAIYSEFIQKLAHQMEGKDI